MQKPVNYSKNSMTDNPLKLYPVTLSMTVMVAADSEENARQVASGQVREIIDNELWDCWTLTSDEEIQTLDELKGLGYSDWEHSLPYGDNPNEKMCWQILDREFG